MTISRKGSRKIRVDGFEYLWKVSKNGVLHLVIFIKCGGIEMKVVVNYPRGCHRVIKPKEVKRFILQAIKDGWSTTNSEIVYSAADSEP